MPANEDKHWERLNQVERDVASLTAESATHGRMLQDLASGQHELRNLLQESLRGKPFPLAAVASYIGLALTMIAGGVAFVFMITEPLSDRIERQREDIADLRETTQNYDTISFRVEDNGRELVQLDEVLQREMRLLDEVLQREISLNRQVVEQELDTLSDKVDEIDAYGSRRWVETP